MSVANQHSPEQGSIKPAPANRSPNKSPSFSGSNNNNTNNFNTNNNNNNNNNNYLNVPNKITNNNSPNVLNKNNNSTENSNNNNTNVNGTKRSPNKAGFSDNLGNSPVLPNTHVGSNAPKHSSVHQNSNSVSDPPRVSGTPGDLGSLSNPIPIEDGGKKKPKKARRSHRKSRNAKSGTFQKQPEDHPSADPRSARDQPHESYHERPQFTAPHPPHVHPQSASDQPHEPPHKRPRSTPPNQPPVAHPQNARDQRYDSSYRRHQAPPAHPQSPPLPLVPHFPPNSPPLPTQAPLFHPPHSPLFQPQPSHSPLFQPPSVRPNSPPVPLPHPSHFAPTFDHQNTPELSLRAPTSIAHAQDRAQVPPHQPYPVPSQNTYKQKRDFYHPNRPPSGDFHPISKTRRTSEFSPPIHLPTYPPSPSYPPAFSPPYQFTPTHSPLHAPPYATYAQHPNAPSSFDNTPRPLFHPTPNTSPPTTHPSHPTSPPTSYHNTSPPHPSHTPHHTQHHDADTHEKPRDAPRNPAHRNNKFLHNKPGNNKQFNNRGKNPQFKKGQNFKQNSKHNSQHSNNNNQNKKPAFSGKNSALFQENPTSRTQFEASSEEHASSLQIIYTSATETTETTETTEITETYTSTITTTSATSAPTSPTDFTTAHDVTSNSHELNSSALPIDPTRSNYGNNTSLDTTFDTKIDPTSSHSIPNHPTPANSAFDTPIDPSNHTAQSRDNIPSSHTAPPLNNTSADQNIPNQGPPRNSNTSPSLNNPLNHNTHNSPQNRNQPPNHNTSANYSEPSDYKTSSNRNTSSNYNTSDYTQQINDTSSNSSTELSLPIQPPNFKKRKSVSYEATATNSLRAKYGPNTIYICNLPHIAIPELENRLRSFFSTFGTPTFLRVSPQGKEGKGTAYVTFDNHLAVENAMKETLKIEGRYASMKDLDTGQVKSHLDPAHRSAIQAITRELFVKLNHRENIHKLFRLDNVCYGISYTGENGKAQKASAIIKDAYGSLGLYLLADPFNKIFVVNDKTRTIECNHSLSLSQIIDFTVR